MVWQKHRLSAIASAVLLVIQALAGPGAFPPTLAQAVPGMGTVCVIVYHDVNLNGTRDPAEDLLPDANVNLMVASNVVVANHVAAAREPHCFENLPPQQYTLSVDSPLYSPVSTAPVTFMLAADERATHEFGAVPRPTSVPVDPSAQVIHIPLTMSVRLALAMLGAALMMLLFGGLGLILFGILLYRRFPTLDDSRDPWLDDSPWEELRGVPVRDAVASRAAEPDTPYGVEPPFALGELDESPESDFDDPFGRADRA